MPPVAQLWPSGQLAHEPAEGATADQRPLQLFCDVPVLDVGDEERHVAVAVTRAFALDPEPQLSSTLPNLHGSL